MAWEVLLTEYTGLSTAFLIPTSWVGERIQLCAEENRTRHEKTRKISIFRTERTGKIK